VNELYQVREFTVTPEGVTATVQLNPEHLIFKGHFPGQPVLPGVCMMELVREIAEKKQNTPLRITAAPQIKFLHMVDPRQTDELQVEMTIEKKEQRIDANGRLFRGPTVFVKFRLELGPLSGSPVEPHGIS